MAVGPEATAELFLLTAACTREALVRVVNGPWDLRVLCSRGRVNERRCDAGAGGRVPGPCACPLHGIHGGLEQFRAHGSPAALPARARR